MKHNLIFLCCWLLAITSFAQDTKHTISGYIEDATTGEKLLGANIYSPQNSLGTVTNVYGFYSLTLPAATDSTILAVSYVGYETKYFKVLLNKDIQFNPAIGAGVDLAIVEVVAEDYDKIEERTQMSTVEIPIDQIKQLPALLGETDILKALQLLPGVQSGGEGTSGLYVRGGSPDQNLILLDGVPVYNANHLFGFFSVFNADAVKNVTLTKGGFPARYGGRLSSVLEINMKEGNMKEFHGEGGVGIISSRLTLEGPIIKDKTSFVVSGRRTYIDVLAQPFIKAAASAEGSNASGGYYFYDLNAKVNHKFSDKDRLYLSVYTGKDKFYAKEKYDYNIGSGTGTDEFEFGLNWGNVTSALRWNHLWTNKLFSNVTMTYTSYEFETTAEETTTEAGETNSFGARYFSGIEDLAGKIDFDFVPNPKHYIRFGANATYHTFKPGATNISATDTDINFDTTFTTGNTNAVELYAYVEDDWEIFKNFKANVGLHLSGFSVNNTFYQSLQPRLGLRYLLPNDLALKGSFSTMTQYIHLLTNEGIGLPTDLWVPSTENIAPENSWQAALGVAKTFKKEYEISAEVYYKEMTNLVSYKPGESFIDFGDWQDKIASTGAGESYGLELFVQKKKGATTGWLGYTLSWSWRQFEGTDINFGERYPFRYDRRHDISAVLSHKFTERIRGTIAWVYGTGKAVTLPVSGFNAFNSVGFDGSYIGSTFIETAENKNGFREPAYHRLDIGFEFHKKKKRWERTWKVGVYNAYSRQNPYFLFIGRDRNTDQRVVKQLSLFPIIPSVSYNFKF